MKNLLLILTMTAFVSSCSKTQTPADNSVSESSPDVRVEEQSIVLEAPIPDAGEEKIIGGDFNQSNGFTNFILGPNASSSDLQGDSLSLKTDDGNGSGVYIDQVINTIQGEDYTVSVNAEILISNRKSFLQVIDSSSNEILRVESTVSIGPEPLSGTFTATGSSVTIRLSWDAIGTGNGHVFDNLSVVRADNQNSNEVIDFGVLSKVGQKSIKRVYISNNTGETRTISDAEIVGDGISVLANTCSSLSNGGLCYMDLQYELVSDSQAGLGGDIIADIVSNDPVDATPDWGILSLKGSLGAEIDDGIVNVSDISLSSEALFFGTLQEGASVTKRVYISNSSTNNLENLAIVVGSPYTIVRNGCDGTLNAKRLCSVDIQLSYDAGVSANAGLSMTADSVDLSSVVASLDGISALEDTDNQFAALDGSGSPVDLTLEGADADYSDIGVGNSRSVRIYFSNQNNDYDFGSPSSVGVLGDVVVDRTSCEGLVKEGSVCYVDVTYTRQLIPATDTKLSIAPGLEYEFALPGGVFDESYFDSAVFQ